MPGVGSVYLSQKERLKDLRKWHVKGFKRFSAAYLDAVLEDGELEPMLLALKMLRKRAET
jgi:predicted trehalose synthase